MTSVSGALVGTPRTQAHPSDAAKAPDFNSWFSGAMDALLSREAEMSRSPRTLEHQEIDHHDLRTKLREQLSAWTDMSVGERLRQQYFDAHDLNEEALVAMPADERAAVEKDIADYVAEGLKRMTGLDDEAFAPETQSLEA